MERQRPVVIGEFFRPSLDESFTWERPHGGKHSLIAHTALGNLEVDHPVARTGKIRPWAVSL